MMREWRRWSKKDDDLIIDCYGKVPIKELSHQLGRSIDALHVRGRKLGVKYELGLKEREAKVIKDMNSQGYGDVEIANALGRSIPFVIRHRAAMSLPSQKFGWRYRLKVSAREKGSLHAKRMGEVRLAKDRLAREKYAKDSGWPEKLTARQVQLLNCLARLGLPAVYAELAIQMQVSKSLVAKSLGPLLECGLVVPISEYRRRRLGKGTPVAGYILGPAALQILKERADAKSKEQNPDGGGNGGNSPASGPSGSVG